MQDPLIQTRVPESVLQRVQEAAAERGDTIAGWLRRLVLKETQMNRIGAWLVHHRHADPSVHFSPGNFSAPTYYLEPIREHDSLERVFNLYGHDGHTPVLLAEWQGKPAFRNPADYRFLLAGSPNTWHMATSVHNVTTGIIEVALRSETSLTPFRTFSEANTRFKELGASYSRSLGDRGEGRATLALGSVHVALDVAAADLDEMVLPRLVAMLERGLGLQ
jgi:hypothetical protein